MITDPEATRVIYFVHGPDRLLAHQAVLAIAADFDPSGSNTTWLDGRETSFAGVVSAVGTASFFDTPRVVIVTDLLVRASRDAETGESTSGIEERSGRGRAARVVSAVPKSHHLIIFEPALTSVPAIFKTAAPGDRRRATAWSRLLAWIESAALGAESRIDRRTAQRLAETLYPQTWQRKPSNTRYDRPPDLALLETEIEKLALAAHPGSITIDHISLLTACLTSECFDFSMPRSWATCAPGWMNLSGLSRAAKNPRCSWLSF